MDEDCSTIFSTFREHTCSSSSSYKFSTPGFEDSGSFSKLLHSSDQMGTGTLTISSSKLFSGFLYVGDSRLNGLVSSFKVFIQDGSSIFLLGFFFSENITEIIAAFVFVE